MKTLNINLLLVAMLLIMAFANPIIGQVIAHPQSELIDINGKVMPFEEIVFKEGKTMVVFWNSGNKKHIEFLDLLNEREEDLLENDDIHIVAICSDKYHNYLQLQTLSSSRMWNFSLYLDVNRSFKRVNGISHENLRTILYEDGKVAADSPITTPDLNSRNYLIES
jgi:hypothetical protein